MEPTLNDVGTEFGEGGQEVPLRGAGGQSDEGPLLASEDTFEGGTLFMTAVERTTGLEEVEDPAPVNRVGQGQREHSDERSPVLVASNGQGFADASDNDGVFPFHPARWVVANAFDGPEAGRSGIGQMSLDVPVGQGGIDQDVSDASDPFDFGLDEHGEMGAAHGGV